MSMRSDANEVLDKARDVKDVVKKIDTQWWENHPREPVKVKNRDELYSNLKEIVAKLDSLKSQVWDKKCKIENDLKQQLYLYENLPQASKDDPNNKTVIRYNKQKRISEDISAIYDDLKDYYYSLNNLKSNFLDRTQEDTGLNLKINKV